MSGALTPLLIQSFQALGLVRQGQTNECHLSAYCSCNMLQCLQYEAHILAYVCLHVYIYIYTHTLFHLCKFLYLKIFYI